MADIQEVIEAPLSGEELAVRYRALCDDPCYANVPGKLELDLWGRVLMSPPSFYDGYLAAGAEEVWLVFAQSKRWALGARGRSRRGLRLGVRAPSPN